MSFITTARVNDFEIGSRRSEMLDIRKQIKTLMHDRDMKPDERSRLLRQLASHYKESKEEYSNLCKLVRTNFI